MRALVVEDDEKIAEGLRRGLTAEGFTVEVARDGDDGLWLASESSFDVLVVDLMLPGRDGFQICGELRRQGDWTPILVLTARTGEFDETHALDTGADDFLSKPFSFSVLVSRLRALTRRGLQREPAPVEVGDLRIDNGLRSVSRGSQEIHLTAREFDVLELLVRRAGRVVSKSELLDGVWGFDFEGDANVVEVYVRRLRRKLDEPFGRHSISTIRGVGYRIVDDDG